MTYGLSLKRTLLPKTFPFNTSLPGDYNQANCLAAIAATQVLEVHAKTIRQSVADFGGVNGRMEKINRGQNFRVVVDFAHTPNGLKQALITLDEKKGRKLIVVFGAAGLRDRGKRPVMGEIAGHLADLVVLTAEDPSTEDVHQIINQIAQGVQKAGAQERPNLFSRAGPPRSD